MTPQQTRMFGSDDLPLFSGGTMHVEVHPFLQQPAASQARLAACPICLDTGYITTNRVIFLGTPGEHACTCDAGIAWAVAQHEEHGDA